MGKEVLKKYLVLTFGILVILGATANPSLAKPSCSKAVLAGNWSYSEQGTHVKFGPWSELGSFTLDRSGAGSGVAAITAAQGHLVDVRVPLNPIQLTSFNEEECIGTFSFIAGGDTAHPRTITFTFISRSAFDFISTTGDVTIVGHAIKR
jgi:hypothetical protein